MMLNSILSQKIQHVNQRDNQLKLPFNFQNSVLKLIQKAKMPDRKCKYSVTPKMTLRKNTQEYKYTMKNSMINNKSKEHQWMLKKLIIKKERSDRKRKLEMI